MFDLDPGKMLVFGIVALAVIPPKDLPRVLRTVGKYIGQIRRMGADFQGQFTQALKEADLDSVRKEIDDINKTAKAHTSFDPADLMRDKAPKIEAASPYETVKVEAPQPTLADPSPAPESPVHDTPAHDVSAHDVSAHDISAHDISAHDVSAHDVLAHDVAAHVAPAHEPEKIAVGPT